MSSDSRLIKLALSVLIFEEGYRSRAYYCSLGYPTIGYGFKLGPKKTPLSNYVFELTEPVAKVWLEELIQGVISNIKLCPVIYDAYKKCNEERQAILISMAYQLGITGLSKFVNFLTSVAKNDWKSAHTHMLDSKWHEKQTPHRAKRHAHQIITGIKISEYS